MASKSVLLPSLSLNLGDTVIDITLETRGTSHIQAISSALQEAGYKFERIA